jgi:hypothetical protein
MIIFLMYYLKFLIEQAIPLLNLYVPMNIPVPASLPGDMYPL